MSPDNIQTATSIEESELKLSFEEQAVSPFEFEVTAKSHGWLALRPFTWDQDKAELCRIHLLADGKVVRLRICGNVDGAYPSVQVNVETAAPLAEDEEREVRLAVRRMLRLDEDLTEFHQLAAQMKNWTLRLSPGAGRLLRCPSLFEDIVYTLCTTNIAWSGTIRMVDRLTAKLGQPFMGRDSERAFPTPAAIAAAGPEFLKQETGLGYRSTYVWELASTIVEGRLDLTPFEEPELSTDALHKALLQIKGVGSYAAATILMLLGRYEHLAIDSELRAFVNKKYSAGEATSDSQIRAIYAPWGRWRYLAFWFDAEP